MTLSRRMVLTVLAAGLAAPSMAAAQGCLAAGAPSRTISARVRLPGGQWKLFSCSVPGDAVIGRDAALACVRERNGVGVREVAELTIA
jgi:hypothetical protein